MREQGLIQHLNPMPYRHGRTALQMRDAADVGGHDHLGFHFAQVTELAVAQRISNFWLQYRISARRAATQVRFATCSFDVEAECAQMLFNTAAQLLAVLQCAGRVESDLTCLANDAG